MSRFTGIDVLQACLNGHLITPYAYRRPDERKAFCSDCGAATTMSCSSCNALIPGKNWDTHAPSPRKPPNYCQACGNPHHWHQLGIANAIEVLEELQLSEADLTIAKNALPDLVSDTPRSEIATLKMQRVLGKLGKPAYDIAVKVISDLVSETVKKTLKP